VALVDGAVFGVAAAVGERRHVVADGPAGRAVSKSYDLARDFEAEKIGRARRCRVEALALHEVGAVDPRRLDADQHFPGRGARHRATARNQHLRPARGRHLDHGHIGRHGPHRYAPRVF
jgi:hypothetical protein